MAKRKLQVADLTPMLSPLTSLLDVQQRVSLIEQTTVHTFKKNEVIYSEGDDPQFMHCLVAGKVKIHKLGAGGRRQIVRVVRPVEFFGYRAAFARQLYVNTAAAFEPSVILRVPIAAIMLLMRINASLACFFVQRLATDLGRADERMVNLTQKHIQGRLAESLLFLRDSYGMEEDGSTLSIYLSREDLASLSNMTTANAIRTLRAFCTENILAVDGRKIKFLDVQRLEQISRLG